jgi:hypothetical protein
LASAVLPVPPGAMTSTLRMPERGARAASSAASSDPRPRKCSAPAGSLIRSTRGLARRDHGGATGDIRSGDK